MSGQPTARVNSLLPTAYLLKSVAVALFLLTAIDRRVICTYDCQVFVDEPWPVPHIFAPRESTVEINCTAGERSYLPSCNLNQKERLNAHNVYQLPQIETPGMPPTLRLLINDTIRNNQTRIQCDRSATSESTTTLFVVDPISILLTGDTVGMGINLSWSREPQGLDNSALGFLLTISHGSSCDNVSLNESYYHFTAPEGAPPCEVYNFSITATYVGATYTGAGCSVPSPVLSTMLPSLPSIDRLESSFNYVLSKKSGGLSLQVSFEPASYCENYPVANYTLVIISSFSDELLEPMLAIHADNLTFDTGNLSENAKYSFRILVSNTVGIVSTNNTHFYTTDVQRVVATLSNGMNASTLQCEFIVGSNATGCMVVLTSEDSQKAQYNLTRNITISEVLSVTLEHSPSCYTGVEAFDIESDGSVGTLPVPGQLGGRLEAPCVPLEVIPESSSLSPWIITTIVVAAMGTLLCGLIAVTIVAYKSRRVGKNICQCTNSNDSSQADDHYEQIPMNNWPNEINCTDIIKTAPNVVYGVSTDGIETTPNAVYGVSTDGIETIPNAVYGVSTDGIETTPNEVYGVSTDGIETTPNKVLQDNF